SEEGDDKMAARSVSVGKVFLEKINMLILVICFQSVAGDEIVAATIHLDHFNQGEVLKILKVLEPYDKNMVFLTKKQLGASADLGSFGLVLYVCYNLLMTQVNLVCLSFHYQQMLNFKKDLSLDASLDGLSGKLNASQGLGGEIGGPTLNGDLPSLSLSKPSADASAKFPMPSLGLNGPDIKGDLDGTLKAPNVSVFPKINTKSASLDLEKPKIKTDNLKYKAPKFTMPHFNLPQLKTPKADMHVSGDTSLPFSDFSLNTPKINGDLSAPDVDINLPKTDNKSFDLDVQTPNPDIDASSGKFWTNFRKKPKLHSPKAGLDLDANLNTPHVDPSLSKMEAPDFDINLPKAELDMQTPNIDVDAPSGKTNWLNWKWKNPKLQGPKADLDTDISVSDVLTPTIEGDINVPNTELNLPKADLSSPNVDFQAPDINAPSGKINWPHLKWKKNKLHGPKADMDLSADLSTPDVDLTAPKIDGALSTPDVDLNLPRADVDVKAPETGKLRFPTLKKGKFLLSGPKVKSSLIDVDAEAPDLNLSPKASLDGPDVDLNLPQADVKAPNVDIMKAPDLPRADLKGPELGIDTPDCDNSGKLKWFNLKKPKFGTPKGPKGDIDVDVKVPQMDLNGVDVNMSAPKIKTPKLNMADPHLGINGPDTNYDINLPKSNVVAPNVDLKATDLTLSAPKIDFNAPDLDINVPKADLKGPHIDLQTPGIDTPAGKLKLPKINLPGFGRKGLEVKGPNLNVDAENVNLPDVNLKLPKAAVKTPCLNPIKGDLCTPDLDLDAALNKNVDLSGPKTTISVPNINVPTLDTKGSHLNLNLPQADVTGPSFDLKAPDLSLSPQKFAAPKIDTKGPKTELEAPVTLKHPKFGLENPKVEVPSVSTAVENGIEAPKVNMVTPINTPELDITAEADAEVKGTPKSRIKWPFKWGLKSGTESNEEESGDESETVVSNADLEVPVFKMHKLPRNNLDGIGGTEDILSVSKLDSEAKDYIVSKGIRLPIVNPTTTAGEKIDIRQRLKMATEKSATANISTTEATRHTLNVNTSANTDSLVRGGTFKVDKPESIVGLVAPEISIPDERDKLSLSLSNMLGLNVKDSDAD
uniref:Uncharacterized protein n=1 Tax=Gasterosteus aculeatus aculeatus TaxID=481459 RepID=A0AAQ4RQ33_GASAC